MAQLPAQLAAAASRRSAKRALCHDPAASVPKAPATQTITTTNAVCGDAASATTPPAASIIAAANCVGARARSASCVVPTVWLWESDQVPKPAEATAAHTHTTPAINMGLTIRVPLSIRVPGSTGLVSAPNQRCWRKLKFGSGGSPGTRVNRFGLGCAEGI
jgi:hypothetical protein